MPTSIATHKKRRGVVQASITRLCTKITGLEDATDQPNTPETARQLLSKLETLNAEFKVHHLAIVDQEPEELMDAEQDLHDRHGNEVAELSVRVRQLIASCSSG